MNSTLFSVVFHSHERLSQIEITLCISKITYTTDCWCGTIQQCLRNSKKTFRLLRKIQYSMNRSSWLYEFFFQKLSRKELRPLRRNLSSRRELKRCGKRIQLHCDPDENQFIFESEWLTCVLKQQEGNFILILEKHH